MPKGIEKLTKLQVLNGFLIGSPSKTPCRISDLANLKKLRRLSIRIGIGAVIKEREFESLVELAALEHLKISWGVSRNSKMSVRTNPMKAVPVLLKRVKTTRTILDQSGTDESLDGKLDKLTRELNKIEDVFMRVKKNQDELVDTLHEVDGHLRKLDRKKLDQDMDGFCKRIRDCAHKLLPMDAFESEEEDKSGEIVESSSSHDPSSTQHNNNQLHLCQDVDLNKLTSQLGRCLLSLSIFPEDAAIKKKQAIYLWIGAWNIIETGKKTAEEVGEDVFDELLKLNLVVPYGNGKCPVVNKFQINPHIRPHLESLVERENTQDLGFYFRLPESHWCTCLVLEQQKVILGDGVRLKPEGDLCSIVNFGASYLNFGSQWLDKRKYLRVLLLGYWQDSPSHHIEVGSQKFLKKLRTLNGLTYLSLRGISRISELPPSIAQLEWLEILDLKACHNLETLPNDISSMKSLTHLILSQCYLLDSMPKGIEKLTQLQVLEGFLLGNSRKTPCRISDLAKLKELRRLSIHIGTEAVIKDREFTRLGRLSALKHLKLSWGVSGTRYSDIQIILPPSLKKLHLEGFPGQKIPEWLKPSKLPIGFRELNITGGKLESMNHDEDANQWAMEIVRLKYLKYLEVDLTSLQMLFPSLRYALIKPIPYHSYIEWSIDQN